MSVEWLNTRTAAAVEILLVLLITAGHRVFHVIPIDETLPILAMGWLSCDSALRAASCQRKPPFVTSVHDDRNSQ